MPFAIGEQASVVESITAGPGGPGVTGWFVLVVEHMVDTCDWRALALSLLLLLAPFAALAQQGEARWITDRFEVTMRTGKSTKQSIVRMLPSGAQVEVLETDREAGYARVRTPSGAEGWVLNRYLVSTPPARVRLPELEQRLARSEARNQALEKEKRALEQQLRELQQRISALEGSKSGLQQELAKIRQLSANVVQIDEQNALLRERLGETERTLTELQLENQRLASRSSREWFIVGAGVLVFGMLLGLILPRIRWRRKSSWSDF